MKPRACPPNDGIWFVGNCLMRRYLGLDDLPGQSKTNQTKTSQSSCHFPGLGNGNPLKFLSNDLACQECAWSASKGCLPALGCGEGGDHQEIPLNKQK